MKWLGWNTKAGFGDDLGSCLPKWMHFILPVICFFSPTMTFYLQVLDLVIPHLFLFRNISASQWVWITSALLAQVIEKSKEVPTSPWSQERKNPGRNPVVAGMLLWGSQHWGQPGMPLFHLASLFSHLTSVVWSFILCFPIKTDFFPSSRWQLCWNHPLGFLTLWVRKTVVPEAFRSHPVWSSQWESCFNNSCTEKSTNSHNRLHSWPSRKEKRDNPQHSAIEMAHSQAWGSIYFAQAVLTLQWKQKKQNLFPHMHHPRKTVMCK